MKLIITNSNENANSSSTVVANLLELNSSCLDAEATEIVVDNFLHSFPLKDVAGVVHKILSKLRIGGSVTFIEVEFELLADSLSKGEILLEDMNDLAIDGKYVRSFISLGFLESILSKYGLKITEKSIHNKSLFILKGTRC